MVEKVETSARPALRRTALGWMHRYGTPLTVGLFAVSTVSGVALFFRLAPAAFHSMHEWLSLLLLVPFGVHMWKNWRPLVGYARRRTLFIPIALTEIAAIPFVYTGLTTVRAGGGQPAFRVVRMLTQTPLTALAQILKTTPDALQADLQRRGFTVASADDRLDKITAGSDTPPERLLFDLIPSR